jgi:Trypsin-like peptidase domain
VKVSQTYVLMWTQNSVGIVGAIRGSGRRAEVTSFGTCFSFRQQDTFLTARHCVADDLDQAGLIMPGAPGPVPIASVEHHAHADVSVLRIDLTALEYKPYWQPFWNFVGNWSMGEEFMAFGYPIDTLADEDQPRPKPRLFRGHYQRFWFHRAGPRFSYLAGDLNIAAPTGLSGGPVFRPGAPEMVTGLVVENIDSTTDSFSVEERLRDGVTVERTVNHRIVSYGVAVMLSEIGPWLDERIPAYVHSTDDPPRISQDG